MDCWWLYNVLIWVICCVELVIWLNVFFDKWMIVFCVKKLLIDNLLVNLVVLFVGNIWLGFVV